jgi:hypothetical protein
VNVSQPDQDPLPDKIPDDLWYEIKRLKAALATFAFNAQMSAQEKELYTGECDLEFYRWLQPLTETVNQMRLIKRYAPTTAEVIPFPKKIGETG